MVPNIDPQRGADMQSAAEFAALTDRVAQLERQVAALTSAPPVPRAAEKSWQPPPIINALMPVIPPRILADPPPPPAPGRPPQSLESRLGSQVFNMIGILAILIGTSWFLKMAIERGWIGPVARVLVGLTAGAGLVLWSESFRRKGLAAFSYSLKAIGSAILYLTLWAAFQLYHLLPPGIALVAMLLVTAWNGFMAWSQDAELLAGFGLLGGMLTPFLLSSGGNHEGFLFTYLGAIDAAVIVLTRWKPWRRLLLPAFAATAAYFLGWYLEFFHLSQTLKWDAQSTETTGFVLMFFAMFAAVSMQRFRIEAPTSGEVIAPVLIPLANAAWLSVALYLVMQDSVSHSSLAWLMVALAALYLGLMRVQATTVASAMHLACAVVFLTIAIPLKASGHSLTTAWLVEGLVLYWASTRVEADSGAPARVLTVLSISAFSLGLLSLAFHWFVFDVQRDFFNANLGAAVIAVVTLAGLAWLAAQSAESERPAILLVSLVAIDLVALLLVWGEVVASSSDGPHAAFANPQFTTALLGLAILGAVAWSAYRLCTLHGETCTGIAGLTLILFNLLTILSIEREIGALWSRSDANLQRSLAISGFLMLYAALLLTAGFWKRSEFVRWQALLLLLFTIGKVFLYDISSLSQGYRVASFLTLGALLMGISLAYQKDWLGLRRTVPHASGGQ